MVGLMVLSITGGGDDVGSVADPVYVPYQELKKTPSSTRLERGSGDTLTAAHELMTYGMLALETLGVRLNVVKHRGVGEDLVRSTGSY